ncbi:MAG TPA: helix-turn-helix domain-containing protein [Novosphingobium sp.]|nr:helix-turn-helix domain-containing protein [Novosphingobium sp.]
MNATSRETPHFDVARAAQVAEAYAGSIDPIFSLGTQPLDGPGADVGLDAYHAGAMLIGRAHMHGARFDYARDRAKIARTGLDMILVQIITAGSDVRFHGDEVQVTRPGDICIDDLTRPFATRATDCENINIILPRAALGLDALQLDRIHGLSFAADSLAARLVSAQANALLDRFDSCSPGEAAAAARATGLMIGGLAAPLANQREAEEAISVAVLHRVQRYIQAHLARPDLTPDGIARAVGLSRASLYRIFSPIGGVREYIRQQRLGRVFADLRNPRLRARSIAEMAYGWGFADWSSFSRAFKAQFAVTPSEVRGLAGVLAPADSAGIVLPQWLREMEAGEIGPAMA